MADELLELAQNLRSLTIPTTEYPLEIVYRPGIAMSLASMKLNRDFARMELREKRGEEIDEESATAIFERLVTMLQRMIDHWNMRENGLPVELDWLEYQDVTWVGKLFALLFQDASTGPKSTPPRPSTRSRGGGGRRGR